MVGCDHHNLWGQHSSAGSPACDRGAGSAALTVAARRIPDSTVLVLPDLPVGTPDLSEPTGFRAAAAFARIAHFATGAAIAASAAASCAAIGRCGLLRALQEEDDRARQAAAISMPWGCVAG